MARIQTDTTRRSPPKTSSGLAWCFGLVLSGGLVLPQTGIREEAVFETAQSPIPEFRTVALNSGEYIPIQEEALPDLQASFIVKFKDQAEVTALARSFRKDRVGAQQKFAQWAQSHRALRGLILTSASYSGELILSLPANDPLNRSPKDVLEAIRAMDSCVYAELDTIAYPSSRDQK
ncbi:MAG: hypothetical protein AAGJ84_15485 [Pseudomonadota bacterium]